MAERTTPSFGDHVRILPNPETEVLGVAGRVGVVYGESVPSLSGVGPIVGDTGADFALNVDLEDGSAGRWYAPHLIAFVDHAPGSVLEIGDHRLVRDERGAWVPTPPMDAPSPTAALPVPPPSRAPAQGSPVGSPAARSPADFLGRLLDRLWPR